jgi:hypothetical protein
MANSDKNVLITPNRNLSGQPEINFTGFGNSSITLKIPDSTTGTLNFESSGTNLFSVDSNYTSNTIFSLSIGNSPSIINLEKNRIFLGLGGKVTFKSQGLKLPSFTRNSFPKRPKEGTLIYDNSSETARCYNGTKWLVLGNKRDGLTPDTAAESAQQILDNYPNSYDGIYWFKTPEMENPIQLFVDMTRDGGGWVLISKWGGYSKSIGSVYSAYEHNINYLTNPNFSGYSICGRPSRRDMNCLWNYSKYICRIHFKNDDATATSGVYFQSKLTNVQNFDLWKGHYSPMYWSDFNQANGYQASGAGTYYEVTFANNITDPTLVNYNGNGSAYNAFTNDIIGGSGVNANMGWWDRATVNAPGLGNFEVGRHMGFFGDINQGNQWIFTGNPADSRWASSENRQSMVFLRI